MLAVQLCTTRSLQAEDSSAMNKCIHVNLYGMSVSFTDLHPFKLLTGIHLKSYGL